MTASWSVVAGGTMSNAGLSIMATASTTKKGSRMWIGPKSAFSVPALLVLPSHASSYADGIPAGRRSEATTTTRRTHGG